METDVERIRDAVADAWRSAAGELPSKDPESSAGFAAACWRLARFVDAFEDYDVADAAVVRRSRYWAAPRKESWSEPPVLLADFRQGGRHMLWVVDRAEAANHGEEL